jgi:DNA-binding MarR family transcriptional regulator
MGMSSELETRIERCANGKHANFPSPFMAWLGMARLVQRTEKLITAHLQCRHLNAGQADVLLTTASGDGLTQQELAERLCHSKANVSQLLDKMEAANLVRRMPEGRAYRIYLTDNGRSLLNEIMPEQECIVSQQFDALSADEREELFRLIGIVDPGGDE